MACGKVKVLFLVLLSVAILFIQAGKCEEETEVNDVAESEEGRTFGHHFMKRISFAMIPLMYKLGMMTTLLITLTIMSTKGLAIGVLLLILGISQVIARTFNPVVPAPVAAPLTAHYQQPAVYPIVYSHAPKPDWPAVIPVVQKTAHVPVVHSAPAYAQTYSQGWHAKSGYSPYAREDTEEEPEYVNKS